MSEKTDIKSMDLEELKTFFSDMGELFYVRCSYVRDKYGSMVKRLRHRPFTAVTRVRFPLESLIC